MARTMVTTLPHINFYNYENSSRGSMQNLATTIRDSFRSTLDPDGQQTNWQVSDIVEWTGYYSSMYGYAFKIQHRDGGGPPSTPTGPEWLFVVWSYDDADFRYVVGNNNDSTIKSYWRQEDFGSNYYDEGGIAFHYNDTGQSTPYDMGLDADGSHPSGDFGAPASNPYSALDTFMPSGKLMGFQPTDNMAHGHGEFNWVAIFDDQKPFMAMYATNSLDNNIRTVYIAGEIVVPYRSTDTFTSGSFWWDLEVDSDSQGRPVQGQTNVYTETGSRTNAEDYYHTFFSRANIPFSDGNYPWDVVLLANSITYKGFIDSDIIRVMGPYNRGYLSLYDGGKFIKYHDALVMPYVPNTVVFPPGEGL